MVTWESVLDPRGGSQVAQIDSVQGIAIVQASAPTSKSTPDWRCDTWGHEYRPATTWALYTDRRAGQSWLRCCETCAVRARHAGAELAELTTEKPPGIQQTLL